jgi:hypothetical protein
VHNDHHLRIVLGEAEPDAGILRMVLEAEGFHIVGHASSDEELHRVLAWAQPSVIVLDRGITASAALGARERAPSATLVVVWPPGVAAVVAEERVAPDRVFDDLGNAVRRASWREVRREVARAPVPEPVPEPPRARRAAVIPAREPDPPSTPSRRVRGLVTAATWTLFLVALTTIAAAVPRALDQRRISAPRPHVLPGRSPAAKDRPTVAPHPNARVTTERPAECGSVIADREHGKAPENRSRCTAGHGESGNGGPNGGRGEPPSVRDRGRTGEEHRGDPPGGTGPDRPEQASDRDGGSTAVGPGTGAPGRDAR